jgi:hypothetical protein
VSTDAGAVARFSFETEDPIPKGEDITATATNENGSTSEFSTPKSAVRP